MNKAEFDIVKKLYLCMQEQATLFGEYVARQEAQFLEHPLGFRLVGDDAPTACAHDNRHAIPTVTQEDNGMNINIKGISITDTPRKDGRYQGYCFIDGARKYAYGRTREEVENKLCKLLRGETKPKKKTQKKDTYTVKAWLDKWNELYKKPKLKASTWSVHAYYCDLIVKQIGDKNLQAIDGLQMTEYLQSQKSKSTRHRIYVILNEAFRRAMQAGIIKRNPFDAVDPPKLDQQKKKALTKAEQERFLDNAKTHANGKYFDIFRFLVSTGLRIGEALALTPADFKDGCVIVNKNVYRAGTCAIVQSSTKTKAGERIVPVPPDAMPKMSSPFVFSFAYEAVRNAYTKIAKLAAIKDTTVHSLRHTYATRLEEAGIPPKVKQRLLGHEKEDMTQNTYTDIQDDYLKTFFNAVNNVFNS